MKIGSWLVTLIPGGIVHSSNDQAEAQTSYDHYVMLSLSSHWLYAGAKVTLTHDGKTIHAYGGTN